MNVTLRCPSYEALYAPTQRPSPNLYFSVWRSISSMWLGTCRHHRSLYNRLHRNLQQSHVLPKSYKTKWTTNASMENKQAKKYRLDTILYSFKLIENKIALVTIIWLLVTLTVVVLLCIFYSKLWHIILAFIVWLVSVLTLASWIIIYSEKQIQKRPARDVMLWQEVLTRPSWSPAVKSWEKNRWELFGTKVALSIGILLGLARYLLTKNDR